MRQYLAAKAAHPDALLFFRMGDFYELFFDDAVVAAKALELTLTSRNKGAEDPIPMAGVPAPRGAAAYVQRLLDQGFKVAICEQMADPSTVKGIVPREVVRVATPSIAYDDSAHRRSQEPLPCRDRRRCRATGRVGIAALDFSTGELCACEAESVEAALSEIVRLDPREVLGGTGGVRAHRPRIRAALPRATVRDSRRRHPRPRRCPRDRSTTCSAKARHGGRARATSRSWRPRAAWRSRRSASPGGSCR